MPIYDVYVPCSCVYCRHARGEISDEEYSAAIDIFREADAPAVDTPTLELSVKPDISDDPTGRCTRPDCNHPESSHTKHGCKYSCGCLKFMDAEDEEEDSEDE